MKILLTIGGLAPEHGGPSQTVPALARALARTGASVELLACESSAGQRAPGLAELDGVQTKLLPVVNRELRWRAGGNDFFREIQAASRAVAECVIHDNGLWLPTNHAVAAAARIARRPLMISPRGMLTSWAKRHRGFKKWVAWHLYQRRDLSGAQALHATSSGEADGIRLLRAAPPVAIVPNGVELPPWQELPPPSDGRRTLLFLSRVHPVKGLMNLVAAWARCRPSGWKVVLAGRDEQGHKAQLQAALRQAGVADDFEFTGEVEPARRWDVYRSGDVFVLPSLSENFGLAVAEALACGLPVITTHGTPWEAVSRAGCGWWVAAEPDALGEALQAATGLTDAARRAMGRRGRALVAREFGWDQVATRMLAAYQALLNGTPLTGQAVGESAPC